MRKQPISHALRTLPPAFVFLLVISASLFAQTPGDTTARWGNWWFGIYAGVNYSMFDGTIAGDVGTFDAGSGLGIPAAGGVLEYNPGSLLGFNLMLGYDPRPVDFDQVRTAVRTDSVFTEDLSTSFSYLAIEPSLRINLGSRFFHLLLGPGLGINLGKGSAYTLDSNGTVLSNEVDRGFTAQSFTADVKGALGYDIPLAGPESNTQILLTPFAEFRMALTDYLDQEGDEFKRMGIRGGIQLKFGSRPAAPIVRGPDGSPLSYDFRVDAPVVIAESRRVNETFPIRNYVFFDQGSTAIPARYTKLTRPQAEAFREEQLLKSEGTTGSTTGGAPKRSQRQMEVYYQVLNVFGDRLRRNPSARITLTGAGNGDAAKGKEMAENVKQYLVSTFGISADRITAKGSAMPTNKSGSGGSAGEDKALIDQENWRVEIEGTPDDILAPVNIITVEEQPIGNDVIFRLNPDDNVESTTIEITDRGGATRTFGPYTGNQDVRLDARDLLGAGNREGRYTAKTVYTLKDGSTYEAKGKEFRLVRADPDEEQTGIRYSILFEFDQSKTVKTYEQFLRETVAPAIPNGSTVIIHGHTDAIGTPEHNNKLSEGRVDEARRILTDALTKMGRKVTFDSYGFGEDAKRAPFTNEQPEQRYYNRTVVIEIVPGG